MQLEESEVPFLPQILTARGLSDSLMPTPVAGSKPGLRPSTGLAANSIASKLGMHGNATG